MPRVIGHTGSWALDAPDMLLQYSLHEPPRGRDDKGIHDRFPQSIAPWSCKSVAPKIGFAGSNRSALGPHRLGGLDYGPYIDRARWHLQLPCTPIASGAVAHRFACIVGTIGRFAKSAGFSRKTCRYFSGSLFSSGSVERHV